MCTTALALVTSTAAPAVALGPRTDAAQVRTADEEQDTTGQLVPNGELRGEDLAPSVLSFTQLTPARPGGSGKVRMSLVPEDAATPAMSGLAVVVKVPRYLKWSVPRRAGWRCERRRRGTRLTCNRTKPVLAGRAISMDLSVKVSAKRKVSAAKASVARIRGRAKWTTGRGPARRPWLETSSGTLEIQPTLGVKLTVAGDGSLAAVSDADPEARALQLVAGLSRVVGEQVHVMWRQVRGPAVRFVSDKTVTTDEKQVSQTVLLPKGLKGVRTLAFQVRAESGGQVVTDRARVRIDSERLQGRVTPRNGLIAPVLDQAPDSIRALSQQPTPPRVPRLPGEVRLVGPEDGLAFPGEEVVLRVKSDTPVDEVTWISHAAKGGEAVSVGGTSFAARTPETGSGYLRVQAVVLLANGRTVVRSFVLSPRPAPNGGGAPTPDEDEKKNKALFCSLAKTLYDAKASKDDAPVEVTSKDKSVLTIRPSKVVIPGSLFPTPGDCSGKGAIDFGGAQFVASAGATFYGLEGTISFADGIQVTRMKWTIDDQISSWVAKSVNTLDLAGEVTIGFDPKKPGQWGAIAGTSYLQPYSVGDLTLTGIPFVPLPAGWKISPKDGAFLQFFKDDDKGVPDGSIQLVQKAVGPGTAGASVQVSITRQKGADDKPVWGKVFVAANNIEVFKTPAGEAVLASGDVVFDLARKDPSSEQLNLEITCAAPKTGAVRTACPMGNDVYFKDGNLRMSLPRGGVPTTGGYLLSASIAFGGESSSYVLKAEGAYTSKDSWSVAVKEDVSFDMGPGMSAVGFEGTVQQGEEKVDGEDKVVLTFNIVTTLSMPEFANAVDVKKVSARLTNLCEKSERDCQATEVRLKVGVDLAIPAPGGKTIQAALTGDFNWKTKGLVLKADVGSSSPLGPDEWNFKSGSIFASRAGYGYCQAQDAKQRAPNVWAVGFQGKGTLFGQDTNLTLQFSKEGSCIWGSMGKLATGQVPTSGVQVAWTSFPKGAFVKVSDTESFKIKANTGSLKGKVDMPEAVNDFLGSKGQLEFTGEITGKFEGGLLEIAYSGKSASTVVKQGANTFDLTKVALGMKWKMGDSAEIYARAEGLLTIKGDTSKQIQDSVTPLGVLFSVKASTSGVSITLSGGVTGTEPTTNAFGVQGLTLRELAASATFALPAATVDVKFAADATMPKAWESSGFKAGAPVRLAFSVGTGEPWCVDFEIGVQRSNKVALDVANAGYLTAHWFKLLIAPTGCTVPIGGAGETRRIPAGYGFAFDGYIIGAPIVVALNVGFGTGVASNFTMQGDLKMPKLELPLITLSGADGSGNVVVSLDIDTAKRKYDANIDAGVLVGYPDWGFGARVRVKGQLRTTDPKEVIFQVRASAQFGMTGAYMALDPFAIDLAVPKGTIVPSRAKVHARLEFGILGVKMLSGEVDLAYDRGHLVQFGVLVGASLDIKIAEVTGNLAFRYCLGNIGSSRTREGGLADCSPFAYKASARPGYRIDLGGIMRVAFLKKSYYWNISEQRGGEGNPAYEPKQPPGPLPGPTADIRQTEKASVTFLWDPLNSVEMALGNDTVRFRSIRPADVQVHRESRTVKACSTVQVGTQSYRPAQGTYPNAEPLNPVPEGDCGLIGAFVPKVSGAGPSTVPIVCSQRECVADDKQFRVGGASGSLRQARDLILTLLRQPPGVLPAGAEIFMGDTYWPKDRGMLVGMQAQLRVALRRDYTLVLFSTASGAPKFVAALEELPKSKSPNLRYYLTDRGVLTSTLKGGGSIGENAALDKAPPPESQPVLALVGQQIVVYCGSSQDSGVLWTYGRDGYKKVKECRS